MPDDWGIWNVLKYQVKDVLESITYLENDENNHTTNQEITCTDKKGLKPKVIIITLNDFIT